MRSAYLKDMFGIRYVGAIHGLLNGLVRRGRFRSGVGQLHPRVPNQSRRAETQAYNATMYIMAGRLVIGFICNYMIKAVHERHYMKQEVLDEVGVA